MLAHAFLVVTALTEPTRGPAPSRLIGLTCNEVQHLFATHGTLADGDPARWREMVLTNVPGPALPIGAALPALRQARGRIVLIGSVAGFVHTPGNAYGVTRWAVTGLAENPRRLVTGDGIGVTLVAPGRVATAFWDAGGGLLPVAC